MKKVLLSSPQSVEIIKKKFGNADPKGAAGATAATGSST